VRHQERGAAGGRRHAPVPVAAHRVAARAAVRVVALAAAGAKAQNCRSPRNQVARTPCAPLFHFTRLIAIFGVPTGSCPQFVSPADRRT